MEVAVTQYEFLARMEMFCGEKMQRFHRDTKVLAFWKSARKGYRKRRLALTVEQAALPVGRGI